MLSIILGTTIVGDTAILIYLKKFLKKLDEDGYEFKSNQARHGFCLSVAGVSLIPLLNFLVGAVMVNSPKELYDSYVEILCKEKDIKKKNILDQDKDIVKEIKTIVDKKKDTRKYNELTLEEKKKLLNEVKQELINNNENNNDKPKIKKK